jgi:hypothetical protein
LADAGLDRIVAVNYSPERLLDNRAKQTKFIYEKVGLTKVSSLAVNLLGRIFWANSKDGKNDGAIFSAVADAPDIGTIQVESKLFDSIKLIYFKKELLFFVAPSTASETTMTNTAIYFKAVPKTG